MSQWRKTDTAEELYERELRITCKAKECHQQQIKDYLRKPHETNQGLPEKTKQSTWETNQGLVKELHARGGLLPASTHVYKKGVATEKGIVEANPALANVASFA
jgi:hypothetical protein